MSESKVDMSDMLRGVVSLEDRYRMDIRVVQVTAYTISLCSRPQRRDTHSNQVQQEMDIDSLSGTLRSKNQALRTSPRCSQSYTSNAQR